MKTDLISVVIPIYNVENYLIKCLESVINQTYSNIEVILVDDGSSDNCPKLCDEYALKDKRIKVIHQENKGLSNARNNGIKNSKGKYITFIDSDDYIDKKFIEVLYQNIIKSNASISTCDMAFVYENTNEIKANKIEKITCENYNNLEALKMMLYQVKINNSASSKLYKTELFNEIKFPEGLYYEDLATTYKLFLKSEKIVVSNLPYYYYLQRNDSISKTFSKKTFDILKVVYQMQKDLSNTNELDKAVKSRVLNAEYFVLRQLPKKEYPKEFAQIKKSIKEKRKDVLFDKEVRLKTKLGILTSYISFSIIPFIYRVFKNNYFLKKLD